MQAADLTEGMVVKSDVSDWMTVQGVTVGAKSVVLYVGDSPTTRVGILISPVMAFTVKD
jgi:hypothetical protein